jgi:hypothetical protein
MAMLAHAAGHDPLTDLLNRGAFTERLEGAVARAGRDGRMVAAIEGIGRGNLEAEAMPFGLTLE